MSLKNQLWCGLFLLIISTHPRSSINAAQWELLPERCHDVELSVAASEPESVIDVRIIGSDPYLVGKLIGDRDSRESVLALDYFCTDGIKSPSVFFGPPFVGDREIKIPNLEIAEGWKTYSANLQPHVAGEVLSDAKQLRIDLGRRSGVRLQIRNVRLRPISQDEIQQQAERERVRHEKLATADRLHAYLHASWPAKIHSVRVAASEVYLSGTISSGEGEIHLREFPADQSAIDVGLSVDQKLSIDANDIQIRLPRFVDGRDRLHSAWRLTDASGDFLSPRCFATDITLLGENQVAERPKPQNQKGLTSISSRGPLQELPELGVTALTLNFVLNRFVTRRGGSAFTRIDVPGEPVYLDLTAFRTYDRIIDFARRHDMIVTAIILIPSVRNVENASPLVHPQSDGGVYSMPNLNSARGAQVYARVLDAIAKRYRNHQRSPGAITNWIAHNEVDFHGVWTNMGEQPRPVVTETYYRSMRMIHNAAKQYNPHARVFASLTHHWVVDDDGSPKKSWQQLAPREVIETLQQYSRIEGEFDWGVAYHPYPQSLFAKVAWNDSQVTDDFDTPLITIQNLEVLDRFLHQPGMRSASGDPRPVLLSEQGFHTDSYDDQAQLRQAASLWYAMRKIRDMPNIESFHYHRWIDHPGEGGLMLGLRTLPTKDHAYGERKKSWYVYQAIGTDQEDVLTENLPGPPSDAPSPPSGP
tara:strand:- start:372059 stop:374161 length:2103 start_codon:yes stop_codon:yes gene_type:complete